MGSKLEAVKFVSLARFEYKPNQQSCCAPKSPAAGPVDPSEVAKKLVNLYLPLLALFIIDATQAEKEQQDGCLKTMTDCSDALKSRTKKDLKTRIG